jgi:hypothetical protein
VSGSVGVVRDGWPEYFPTLGEGRVECGLRVWSLPVEVEGFAGRVEGRTTGGRRSCAAPSCGGWFVGVRWETGQQMFICSRGWEFDSEARAVVMTAGVGLSTTVATDRPNTRSVVPPRSQWPDRGELGPSWRVGDGVKR